MPIALFIAEHFSAFIGCGAALCILVVSSLGLAALQKQKGCFNPAWLPHWLLRPNGALMNN